MSKQIYIHIGFKKTASTTIQRSLYSNAALLLENGILYPQAGRKFAHHEVGYLICDYPGTSPDPNILNQLADEIAHTSAGKIIISTEILSTATEAQIRRLKSIFSEEDQIFIVAFIRRQDVWLQSLWMQVFKDGHYSQSFEDFMDDVVHQVQYAGQPLLNEIIQRADPDFYKWLRGWENVFGKDRLIVHVLERREVNKHIFIEVLELLGAEDTGKFEIVDANFSPSAKTIEVIRYYADRIPRIEIPELPPIPYYFIIGVKEFAEQHDWDTRKYNQLTKDIHDSLVAQYAQSNSKLANTYFNREQLFLEEFKDRAVTRYALSDLDPLEVLDLTAFILNKIARNPRFAAAMLAYHGMDNPKFTKVNSLRVEQEQLAAENANLQKEIQAIKATISWKMIGVLRKIVQPIRRLFSRDPGKN